MVSVSKFQKISKIITTDILWVARLVRTFSVFFEHFVFGPVASRQCSNITMELVAWGIIACHVQLGVLNFLWQVAKKPEGKLTTNSFA